MVLIQTTPITSKSLSPWIMLCSKYAPYASTVVFMAPIPTIRKMIVSRTVGGLPLLPYSSMVANCFVWLVYGLLIQEKKVWISNALGAGLALLYCNEYRKYSAKTPFKIFERHVYTVSFLAMLTSFFALALPSQVAKNVVGVEGVLLCVLLFASPLATLKQVIETKSAHLIPIPFTVACLINCILWVIVGWFELNDFMIYAPNLLGFACTLAQVGLKLVYGSEASKKNYSEDNSRERAFVLPV